MDEVEKRSREPFGEREHGSELDVANSEKSLDVEREGDENQKYDGDLERQDLESAERSEDAIDEKNEDVPPNGGYGWVCVACIATINAYVYPQPSYP